MRAPSYNEVVQIPVEYTGLIDLVKCLGDRGNIGSCTGWAAAGLMKTIIYLSDRRDVLPSAGRIYWRSRKYCDPPIAEDEDGSRPLAVMKVLQKEGCPTEDCSPADRQKPFELFECEEADTIAADYKIGTYRHVPVDPASIKASIYSITHPQPYEMEDVSHGKCPLYIVIPVYRCLYDTDKSGVVASPGPNDYVYGYHAVILIGWKTINDELYWIMVNSWGQDEAYNGVYYLPFDYPIIEAWMIIDDEPIPIDEEPQPTPPTPLEPEKSTCRWANTVAALMNVVFLQAPRKRRGRFIYMNPD